MHEIRELLLEMRRRGARVWAVNGQLRYNGPAGVVTAELLDRLKSNKSAILRFLELEAREHADAASQQQLVLLTRPTGDPTCVPEYRKPMLHDVLNGSMSIHWAHSTRCIWPFAGIVDRARLQASFEAVVRHHPVLGCRVSNERYHGLGTGLHTSMQYVDSCRDAAEANGAIHDLLWAPLDIGHSMFRCFCVAMPNDSYLVGFVIHHFIADAHSVQIVHSDLLRHYFSSIEGRPADFVPRQFDYLDFGIALDRWCRSSSADAVVTFWKQELAGLRETRLQSHKADRVSKGMVRSVSRDVPAETLSLLRDCARSSEATLFAVFATAKLLMMSREVQRDDVAIRFVLSYRTHLDLDGVVGNFANLAILRYRLNFDDRFTRALSDVQAKVLRIVAMQTLPFSLLESHLREVGASDRCSTVNFLDFGPVVHNEPRIAAGASNGGPTPLPSLPAPPELATGARPPFSSHQMTISCHAGGARISIQFLDTLYCEEQVGAFLDGYHQVLHALALNPALRLGDAVARLHSSA